MSWKKGTQKKRRRESGPEVIDLSALSWVELRGLAKSAGLNTYHKNRNQLEKELGRL